MFRTIACKGFHCVGPAHATTGGRTGRGHVEHAEVDRWQKIESGVACDGATASRGAPVCLRKAHTVQLIDCTRCAFSREASAFASVPRTSIVGRLVGFEGRFVALATVPFPDGEGHGMVWRGASRCRSR